LIHAATYEAAGVIALAPHVFVEPEAVRRIRETGEAWKTTNLREKLGRFHDHVDSVFAGWYDIWVSPEFESWNIEEYLPNISCPVLAIQCEQDEYGTMAQLDRIAAGVPHLQQVRLNGCGHSPHRDQPDRVIAVTHEWIKGHY
jgi:pimeloyl-ACP methyl ester carboxylesterase